MFSLGLKKTCKFTLGFLSFCVLLSEGEALTYELMGYNVQNLFDSVHDQGKNDGTFLPKKAKKKKKLCASVGKKHYRRACFKTDWNEAKVKIKLAQIKKVIFQERKRRPDFLALSEVENVLILSRLARELGHRDFKMSEGPDKRGIDLALLYNSSPDIVFKAMREHQVKGPYFKLRPTRNILEVEFRIGKKKQRPFTIFINHWPSLSHPSQARLAAAKVLKERVDQISLHNPKHLVVAIGDFNTIPEDFPHPLRTVLMAGPGGLVDIHETFMNHPKIHWRRKKALPPGSYFFIRGFRWNLLDRILISPNLLDGKEAEIDLASYQIYAPDFLTDVYEYNRKSHFLFGSRVVGIPKKYNNHARTPRKAGYSDHFPIIVKINF